MISQLNSALSSYGISASIATDGTLQFAGNTAFTVTTGALAGGATAGTQVATAASTSNSANYTVNSTTALNWCCGYAGGACWFVGGAGGSRLGNDVASRTLPGRLFLFSAVWQCRQCRCRERRTTLAQALTNSE